VEDTRVSLLRRIRNLQDRQSWADFVEIYGPFLLRVLRRHGLGRDDALDVVQETFQAVAQNIGEFEYDPARSFRKYLATIAVRKTWRHFRARERRPVSPGGTQHLMAVQQVSGEVVDEEWYRRRVEIAVQHCRSRWNDLESRVFEMVYFQGLSDEETAGRLGIDIGYEYVLKSRARKKFDRVLEETDE